MTAIYVIVFIYLCVAARLFMVHILNDFGSWRKSKEKLTVELEPEFKKRIDRSMKAMGILVTFFWPAVFVSKPVLFVKFYLLANRVAMMRMFMFYGHLARKLTLQ